METSEGQTPAAPNEEAIAEAPQHGYTADKDAYLRRLRRIEGQVRGLQKMIEEERYCADVLMQLSSVQEALRGVGRGLLQNHLKHCVTEVIRTTDQEQVDGAVDELMELMYRNAR
jgi:CsoR family transcriptional regulator, copper-sensing transcriptional repressor